MTGYQTRDLMVQLGGDDYRICALADRQQFSDPDQLAEQMGISSALWSLFGQVWPAGRILAEAMCRYPVAGKRILELGCGLGLSSLVLQRRGADIVASDHHPLVATFLRQNALQNDLPEIAYHDLDWGTRDAALGQFDLIIGSDVLYERGHPGLVAGVVARHALPDAEVLVTDPGRGHRPRFNQAMRALGFSVEEHRCRFAETDTEPFRGRLLSYRRRPLRTQTGQSAQ